MGNESNCERWSSFEYLGLNERDFDPFPTPIQPLSMDFSEWCGYAVPDYQIDHLPFDHDGLPLTEKFVHDPPFYPLLEIEPSIQNMNIQGDVRIGNEFGGWNNEMNIAFDHMKEQPPLLLCDGTTTEEGMSFEEVDNHVEIEKKKKMRRQRDDEEKAGGNSSCSKALTRQMVSKYFYMPITQAAREMNIGLTLLKKRCRELGIRRWPHRKLMSLQTLINNFQEMQNGGGEMAERKSRAILEILEHQKKLIEEIPDMQLEDQTKRLRQACFKANYKKRKLMGMMTGSSPHQSLFQNNFVDNSYGSIREEMEDFGEEDFKTIFADCFP
ncbi:hypothetical protein M9H77_05002 [Catharanthus roseus]|uniref:Uncharacterized protein n=1 Tax=Catharanthus roseus TaxID=4058 RepID=A0ACC0CG51_CATRO|nr:hypothetical protein M9H77_05002 [Catharanthus roseus]